jgi:hypothetical protein
LAHTQYALRTTGNHRSSPKDWPEPLSGYFCGKVRQQTTKPLPERFGAALPRVKICCLATPYADILSEATTACFHIAGSFFTAFTADTERAEELSTAFDCPSWDSSKAPSDTLADGRRRGNAPTPLHIFPLTAGTISSSFGLFTGHPPQLRGSAFTTKETIYA